MTWCHERGQAESGAIQKRHVWQYVKERQLGLLIKIMRIFHILKEERSVSIFFHKMSNLKKFGLLYISSKINI